MTIKHRKSTLLRAPNAQFQVTTRSRHRSDRRTKSNIAVEWQTPLIKTRRSKSAHNWSHLTKTSSIDPWSNLRKATAWYPLERATMSRSSHISREYGRPLKKPSNGGSALRRCKTIKKTSEYCIKNSLKKRRKGQASLSKRRLLQRPASGTNKNLTLIKTHKWTKLRPKTPRPLRRLAKSREKLKNASKERLLSRKLWLKSHLRIRIIYKPQIWRVIVSPKMMQN